MEKYRLRFYTNGDVVVNIVCEIRDSWDKEQICKFFDTILRGYNYFIKDVNLQYDFQKI